MAQGKGRSSKGARGGPGKKTAARRKGGARRGPAPESGAPRPIGWCGARHRMTPAHEPFLFGPRALPVGVQPLQPVVPAPYDYGFPVAGPRDPNLDEGGEGSSES